MRLYKLPLIAAVALLGGPALAGNLTFESGQTAWHSTACQKPVPPSSIMSAGPEAQGEELNSLISQHNAFADAAQNYMNCVSTEADRDQTMVNQEIAASAQRQIGDTQAQVTQSDAAIRSRQPRN